MTWEGVILRGHPIVKYRDTLRSSVQKMPEPIEIPFGLWARMGPRNHVLDRSPDPLWGGAVFWERGVHCKV